MGMFRLDHLFVDHRSVYTIFLGQQIGRRDEVQFIHSQYKSLALASLFIVPFPLVGKASPSPDLILT